MCLVEWQLCSVLSDDIEQIQLMTIDNGVLNWNGLLGLVNLGLIILQLLDANLLLHEKCGIGGVVSLLHHCQEMSSIRERIDLSWFDVLEETKSLIWSELEEFSELLEWEWIKITLNDIWQCRKEDVLFFEGNFALENVVYENIGCCRPDLLSLETSLQWITSVKSWNEFICCLKQPFFSDE